MKRTKDEKIAKKQEHGAKTRKRISQPRDHGLYANNTMVFIFNPPRPALSSVGRHRPDRDVPRPAAAEVRDENKTRSTTPQGGGVGGRGKGGGAGAPAFPPRRGAGHRHARRRRSVLRDGHRDRAPGPPRPARRARVLPRRRRRPRAGGGRRARILSPRRRPEAPEPVDGRGGRPPPAAAHARGPQESNPAVGDDPPISSATPIASTS